MRFWSNPSLASVLSWLTTARSSKNTPYILAQSAVPVSIIQCNTGITWTLAANPGNGKTRITSSGAHGLTASPAVGKSIYITGWTGTGVANFYNIATVVDGLNLDIDLTYAAGLGNPTVVQANAEMTLVTVVVLGGAMGANGALRFEAISSITSSSNSKTFRAKLGNIVINETTNTTSTGQGLFKIVRNAGGQNAQRFYDRYTNDASLSLVNPTPTTMSVDTSLLTNLVITAKPTAANEFIQLDGYTIEILPGA